MATSRREGQMTAWAVGAKATPVLFYRSSSKCDEISHDLNIQSQPCIEGQLLVELTRTYERHVYINPYRGHIVL